MLIKFPSSFSPAQPSFTSASRYCCSYRAKFKLRYTPLYEELSPPATGELRNNAINLVAAVRCISLSRFDAEGFRAISLVYAGSYLFRRLGTQVKLKSISGRIQSADHKFATHGSWRYRLRMMEKGRETPRPFSLEHKDEQERTRSFTIIYRTTSSSYIIFGIVAWLQSVQRYRGWGRY